MLRPILLAEIRYVSCSATRPQAAESSIDGVTDKRTDDVTLAASHRPTRIGMTMTLSIKNIARQLSKQSRRAIAALIISGSIVSPGSFSLAANKSGETAHTDAAKALDYWIFSPDYCGWASAEASAALYSFNPLATELAKPASCPASNTAVVKEPAVKFVGSAPVIISIAEGYIPYDMSRTDQIALRMYPITIPQFSYVGSRGVPAAMMSGQGPLDCLGYGVLSNEAVSPAQSVAAKTKIQWRLPCEIHSVAAALTKQFEDATSMADAKRRNLGLAIVDAVQPSSELRRSIDPARICSGIGSKFVTTYVASEGGVRVASRSLALSLNTRPKSQTMRQEKSVGERLLVRAGIEANTLNCATAGVADDVARSVCCPVERSEEVQLAAQPPAFHKLAAVGVAAATLSLPREPQAKRDSMVRAEALATACDSAAATLERWASALRRAGDSVVRVARESRANGTAKGGTDLR